MGLGKSNGLNFINENKNGVNFIDVINSGTELPSVSGLNIGDKFLDTENKKLYTIESGVGYGINSDAFEVGDTCVDVNTGNLSGFTTTKYPYIAINSNDGEIVIPFETANDVSTEQAIVSVVPYGSAPELKFDVKISNGKLTFYKGYPDFEDVEIGSVSANTKYVVKIDKAVTSDASHIKLYAEDGTLLSDVTYSGFQANMLYYFGVAKSYSVSNPFLGTILYAIGNDKFSCIGTDIVVTVSVPAWNDGEDLTDLTMYNDTTNDVSYFYNDGVLYSEGGGGGTITKTLNADKTGTPTISDEFVASGFSSSNYLSYPIPYNPNGITWKVRVKFKFTQLSNNGTIFNGFADQRNFRLSVGGNGAEDYEINLLVANGNSWANAGDHKTNVKYETADEWWWLEFGLGNDGKLFVDKSLDGETFTNVWKSSGTYSYLSWTSTENIGDSNDCQYLEIDMNEVRQYVDGIVLYQGTI